MLLAELSDGGADEGKGGIDHTAKRQDSNQDAPAHALGGDTDLLPQLVLSRPPFFHPWEGEGSRKA